jgi:small subunit ribosomal protein S16
MVRIRLRRMGAKKQPSYRVVVADSRAPRDGRFIEVIGFYNPRTEPETVQIDEARALHWLGVGAMPSDAVVRLLKQQGTTARFERLKQGESLDELLAEAVATQEAAPEAVRKTRPVQAEMEPALSDEESAVDMDADTGELGDEEAEA